MPIAPKFIHPAWTFPLTSDSAWDAYLPSLDGLIANSGYPKLLLFPLLPFSPQSSTILPTASIPNLGLTLDLSLTHIQSIRLEFQSTPGIYSFSLPPPQLPAMGIWHWGLSRDLLMVCLLLPLTPLPVPTWQPEQSWHH